MKTSTSARICLLPLLAAALVSSVCLPIQAQTPQDAGQVAVYKASGNWSTNSPNWIDIPGMKGAVTLPAGGDLAVTVSVHGKVYTATDRSYIRILVDGQMALPSSIRLMTGTTSEHSATVNFFKSNLSPGPHLVRAQVMLQNGWVRLTDRSMVLRFATATSPNLRMKHAYLGYTNRSISGYAYMPNMSTTIYCPWPAKLLIMVSGDFNVKNNQRAYVRAVVDGTVTKNAIINRGPTLGCRAFTFTSGKLNKGSHSVKLQWHVEDFTDAASASMTVVALNDYTNFKSGCLQQSPASGPDVKTTSLTFRAIPGVGGGNFWIPSRCDLAIRFSAEAAATLGTRFRLLAKVNGKVVPRGLTELIVGHGSSMMAAYEKVFVVRNLERGWCNVSLEWASSGGTLYLGDRTLTATAIIGQRPLLVTSTESKRPAGYTYGGQFASTVVNVIGGKRVFKPYIKSKFFLAKPGVADWFAENARGHMHVVEAAVVGPYLKMFDEKTYRSLANPFQAMKIEALMKADPDIDYSYYDRDGDGFVRTDELYALVMMYQDSVSGEVRSLPLTVATKDGVTLDYRSGIATAYLPDIKHGGHIGLLNHELSHLILNAGDMYPVGNPWSPTRPGPYSLMDKHGYNSHLDPLHKLKQGKWYEPYSIGSGDRWMTLPPVSTGGSILKLYNPSSFSGEYFLVENRANKGYDSDLPSAGIAIWHCDERRLPNWRTAVEIESMGPHTNPNNYKNFLHTGQQFGFHSWRDFHNYSTPLNSRWHSGSLSNIGLWGIQALNDGTGNMRVFVDTPGPGVLVQFENRDVPIWGKGEAYMRIRVVNTGPTTDTIGLSVNVAGYASWTSKTVTLKSYEARYFFLQVRPSNPAVNTVTITARGAGTATSDTAKAHYTLLSSGTGRIGTTVTLKANNPTHAGELFAMAAALGDSPGMILPGGVFVPLNNDALLNSYYTAPSIFSGFIGTLDAKGQARSYVHVPNILGLRGIRLYFAYVTFSRTGLLTSSSNSVNFATN